MTEPEGKQTLLVVESFKNLYRVPMTTISSYQFKYHLHTIRSHTVLCTVSTDLTVVTGKLLFSYLYALFIHKNWQSHTSSSTSNTAGFTLSTATRKVLLSPTKVPVIVKLFGGELSIVESNPYKIYNTTHVLRGLLPRSAA